jgi:hypothetical protein
MIAFGSWYSIQQFSGRAGSSYVPEMGEVAHIKA